MRSFVGDGKICFEFVVMLLFIIFLGLFGLKRLKSIVLLFMYISEDIKKNYFFLLSIFFKRMVKILILMLE